MFRIMPGVQREQAVQRTFENVKFALDSALLTFRVTIPVDGAIDTQELAVPFKIPYFIDPTSLETTPMWVNGALTIDVSVLAQDADFSLHLLGAKFGQAPTSLFTQSYAAPAGTKLYYHFQDFIPEVDLTPYDGLIVAPEVPIAPVAADRYAIMVQLTFRPFKPFATV